MKLRTLILLAAGPSAALASMLTGCPTFSADVGPLEDGGGGSDVVTDGAPACDPSKDPSCVGDDSGIFVNGASGSDSAAGTKEAPLKTIGVALTKASSSKPNVYVCAGTYAEHVKLTSAVNLVGGFACADWSYATTNRPKVAPTDSGYALDIEGVSSSIAVSDLEFDAINGTKAGESSIAIFVASSNATLKRVNATSGMGAAGADPIAIDPDAGTAPMGTNAVDSNGGAACTNTCGSTLSTGGRGGDGASTLGGVTNGVDGGPAIPPDSFGDDGHGGKYSGGCGSAGIGAFADAADGGAAGAIKAGTLTPTGWASDVSGADGASGGVGQGGGGGSGGISATNVGGGGGGGCGGCGGAGGAAGKNGGSSFAMLAYQSTLTLDTCTLTSGNGGDGKSGVAGQRGQAGGLKGSAVPTTGTGCNGAPGGNGGAGAGGGGGAGGNRIAIGYVGTKPTTTSMTYAEGAAGNPGAGGVGAGSNNGSGGAAGTKGDVQELP